MRWPDWKNPAFRRRLLGIVAVLLMLTFGLHPELRLLVPLLDAAMLDVVLALLGMQALAIFSGTIRPALLLAWQWSARCARGIERAIDSVAIARGLRDRCGRLLMESSTWDRCLWHSCAALWLHAQAGPRAMMAIPRQEGRA